MKFGFQQINKSVSKECFWLNFHVIFTYNNVIIDMCSVTELKIVYCLTCTWNMHLGLLLNAKENVHQMSIEVAENLQALAMKPKSCRAHKKSNISRDPFYDDLILPILTLLCLLLHLNSSCYIKYVAQGKIIHTNKEICSHVVLVIIFRSKKI